MAEKIMQLQNSPRIIGHLDMDAFFASVEERDDPKLKGLPVVVGALPKGGKGRGVVSTANYMARGYGIHSALPISRAWRLSQAAKRHGKPEAIFIFPDMEKYSQTSSRIMAILKKYSPLVEQASIDEAYFDLSHLADMREAAFKNTVDDAVVEARLIASLRNWETDVATDEESQNFSSLRRWCAEARRICEKIKQEIKEKEKLTTSIGIGPNKLIAKLASDFQKPDGLTLITEKDIHKFLSGITLRKIPGIGPKTEIKLKSLGINTIADLQKLSLTEMKENLGKWGADLYDRARGIDQAPLQEEYEIKSIGEQETFEQDTLDSNFIFARFKKLSSHVLERLFSEGFKNFKTVVIVVRFFDFETKSRSHTLKKPDDSLKNLNLEVMKLALPFLDKRENQRKKLIRLIGVRLERLG